MTGETLLVFYAIGIVIVGVVAGFLHDGRFSTQKDIQTSIFLATMYPIWIPIVVFVGILHIPAGIAYLTFKATQKLRSLLADRKGTDRKVQS